MPTLARTLSVLLLAALAAPAAAHDDNWWSRSDEVGRNPVTRTINEKYDFSATGRVTVYEIGGSVEVKSGAGNAVAFTYERRAASQQDLDCEELHYEHGKDELRIWSEHKRGKTCQVIRADDKLSVTVPRGASVHVREVGDQVTVTGVEGMVRLESIGDSVVAKDVEQLDADSIGDSIKLDVARLGAAGIRIDSVGDTVELNLPSTLDARMRIVSVGDEIRGPGLSLDSDDDDYEAVLGKGGPLIRIESVGDSVVIRGPRLTQPERKDRRRHRDRNDD
jgi:hypothetical protein